MTSKALLIILTLALVLMSAGCTNTSQDQTNPSGTVQPTYNVTKKNVILTEPKVGQWVRYKNVLPDGTVTFITYTCILREDTNSWIEIKSVGTNETTTLNVLLDSNYTILKTYLGDAPAALNQNASAHMLFSPSEINTNKVNIQTVYTAYGPLLCIHSNIYPYDVWVHEDIPITGIAKTLKNQTYTVLDAFSKAGTETSG